jgi:Lon protease-like protein
MDGWHPEPGDLPAELAVFPLAGALLLPHGKLPLNIFEPRYKAMVEDALADQRLIGLIQPEGNADDDEAAPALFNVGCLGRLSSFSETDDGRYLIALTGVIRFHVRAELMETRGYRRVQVDFERYLHDLEPPPQLLPQRKPMLAALRRYFTANGFDANWEAIDAMDNDALVVTLAMVCPFEPLEKQALLEAANPSVRADTLVTLLQMGAHSSSEGARSPS